MEYKFDEKRVTENFQLMNQFNVINLIWKGDDKYKGLCRASKTGHGSTLFDKLEPESYQEFYSKLTEYALENKDLLKIYDRGLTLDELIDVAKEFKNKVESRANLSFTLEQYMDYITYVNVIQTFNGHINEVMLVKYIQNKGYFDAHKASGELDSRYGVDILYKNDTRGIQVKAITFFLGNKSSVVNDRLSIKPLKEEVMNKFGIDMKYAIFDRKANKYLVSSNGTPIFSFEEFQYLIDTKTYPHPIFSYNKIDV